MENVFDGFFLGVVQGLTEFIPVSSTGHLILAREAFGFVKTIHDLSFDAVLQLATALAVLLYFRQDLKRLSISLINWLSRCRPVDAKDKNLIIAIIIGTLPSVVLGLLLEDKMATTFRNSSLVAIALFVGSLLMLVADRHGMLKSGKDNLSKKDAFLIGCFQALALIPGISRSGASIAGGLIVGLKREEAAKFSFILSLPLLFGSGLKKFVELTITGMWGGIAPSLILGFFSSLIVGLIAIHFLIFYLKNHSLRVFVAYRLILATLIIIWL